MISPPVVGRNSMTMTTRVQSVSIPVADQDRALKFYTEVLGCEVRIDREIWPGARLVEVVPPGSSVGLVLLPPDSEIPMAVRMGTTDAAAAHARLREAGATLHNDEPIVIDGSPRMFFFADPDGNGLVYLEEEPGGADDSSR
jgi:catechol 2,3-dioxygenase-like lactoylglutathione lyase family enzyme